MSATADDGNELIARALAYSYAFSGYSTLFIDTALSSRTLAPPPRGIALTHIGRDQQSADAASGRLAALSLDDLTLHRRTNLRSMKAALEILRGTFEVVVISSQAETANAFAAATLATADGLLVTVAKGRRQLPSDLRLANQLERAGSRYVGVVAVNAGIIGANQPACAQVLAARRQDRARGPISIGRAARALILCLTGGHLSEKGPSPSRALTQSPDQRALAHAKQPATGRVKKVLL